MSSPASSAVPDTRTRSYLHDLWHRREFAWFLATGDLKARNASTALGLFWWALNPLLLGLVYFLVFGLIFAGRRGDDFLEYLISGMFVFHFTQLSLVGGANGILRNSKLLANVHMPRLILPIASLVEAAIGFLASIGVFYLMVIPLAGVTPGPQFTVFFIVFPVHVVFNLGLAALAARLAVPFRDINNLIPYLTRIWLYLSPIIWPLTLLDSRGELINTIVRLNPMWSILGLYRAALLGSPFDPAHLWTATAWAIGIAVIGVTAFVRYEDRLARHL